MLTVKIYQLPHVTLTQLKRLVIFTVLLFTGTFVWAQTSGEKWEAPKSADALKNPVTPDATSLKDGKTMYSTYCTPCHGDKGKGDGVAAAALAVKPADHSSVKIQSQTDGALFWEMTEGHNPMPSYKKSFTDMQRWQLVNYIRTLAKKTKT